MRKFIVTCLSVSGRGNRIYKYGQVISEAQLDRRSIPELIRNGFIRPENMEAIVDGLKIGIITAIWKRHELFKVFAAELIRVMNEIGVDYCVCVAGSEGENSRQIVESFGFDYVEIENNPVSNKMNAACVAMMNKNVDYVVCTGSDDFISSNAMKLLVENMHYGYGFIGFTDFYFADHKTQTALYWSGYGNGKSIGAFRCLSRELLNSVNWQPWMNNLNSRLDSSMNRKTLSKSSYNKTISLRENNVIAFDYKTNQNITKFERWQNTIEIDINEIIDHGLIRSLRSI
jgi:hypothetical protein